MSDHATPRGGDASDDTDETGVARLLRSLPDPGPMPDDLVARITDALDSEEAARSAPLPLFTARRPVWPRFAAAAAVLGIALAGGTALVASLGRIGPTAGLADTASSRQVAAEAARSAGAAAGGLPATSADIVITASDTAYSSSTFAEQAARLAASSEVAGSAPSSADPLGTPAGARDCAEALGIAPASSVFIDLATVDARPGALLVAQAPTGERTAYLVMRECRRGHPGLVAGPVLLG